MRISAWNTKFYTVTNLPRSPRQVAKNGIFFPIEGVSHIGTKRAKPSGTWNDAKDVGNVKRRRGEEESVQSSEKRNDPDAL